MLIYSKGDAVMNNYLVRSTLSFIIINDQYFLYKLVGERTSEYC